MSIAVFHPDMPTALYWPAEDRALGHAGHALRESISAAMLPPADRGTEIYARVVGALDRAKEQDGTLVSPGTFARTLDVLNALPREIPLPDVVVETENEIGLDWDEAARRVVTLTVRDTPMVGFSALFGVEPMYGRVTFAGEIPETLRILLARLFPRVRRTR